MEVPAEILIAIASRLHIKDLKNFRLVSRQCASAGLSFIPQNGLSVVDTVECIKRFKALLLCSDIANNTRKITFLYGTWPICFSRRDWARHPLLFRGNDRSNATRLHSTNDTAAEKAFEEYSKFREQELSRRYYDDVADIFNILSCLPNLRWVDIGSMETCAWNPSRKPQLYELQKKIWMSPKINYDVTPSLQKFLLAFNNQFQKVKTLSITGLFNSAMLDTPPVHYQLQSIEVLQIESFGTSQNHDMARKFLLAFPNLIELSLNFQGWASSLLDIVVEIRWQKLRVLHLTDVSASEQEIFNIISNHQETLTQFTVNCATLKRGSWHALLLRLGTLKSSATIALGGELCGTILLHTPV